MFASLVPALHVMRIALTCWGIDTEMLVANLSVGCLVGPPWIGPIVVPMDDQSDWDLEILQVNLLGSLLGSSNCSWAVFAAWQNTMSCSRGPLELGYVLGFYSNIEVGHSCQRNIHMNGRTQNFPAKHSIVTRWSMLFTSPVFLCCGQRVYIQERKTFVHQYYTSSGSIRHICTS